MIGHHHRYYTLLLLALSLALQLPLGAFSQTTTTTVTNSSNDIPDPDDSDIRGGSPSPALPYYGVFQDFGSVCGAGLIYGDIALTAAHCVDSGFPGSLRFNSQSRTTGGTTVSVTSRTLHPSWTGSITSADLAILKLGSFLSLTTLSVNSNSGTPVSNGQLMAAAGFGLTSDNSGVSDTLQATTIPYITDCSSQLSAFDNSRMICGDSTGTATCGGDSGSPILLDGTTTQIGINSFSDGDCDGQTLDVYTRVSFYIDWIAAQVCDQSSSPPDSCTNPTPFPTAAPVVTTPSPTPAPTCFLTGGLRGTIVRWFGLTTNATSTVTSWFGW